MAAIRTGEVWGKKLCKALGEKGFDVEIGMAREGLVEGVYIYGECVPNLFESRLKDYECPAMYYGAWNNSEELAIAKLTGLNIDGVIDKMTEPSLVRAICSEVPQLSFEVQPFWVDRSSRRVRGFFGSDPALVLDYRDLSELPPEELYAKVDGLLHPIKTAFRNGLSRVVDYRQRDRSSQSG